MDSSMAQVPTKHQDLSSNPSTTKNRINTNNRDIHKGSRYWNY